MVYFEKMMYLGVMIFNHRYEDSKPYKIKVYKESEGVYDILIDYSKHEAVKICRELVNELIVNDERKNKK